jgi:hypothetical protein
MSNGDYLPTVYQPQPNVTIYTPKKQSSNRAYNSGTYRAYDSTPKPPKPPKPPKVKKQRQKKNKSLPAIWTPDAQERADRDRDLAVGKQLQKQWNAAERLKMKQLRAEQRAQEKHARGMQKARSRWVKKNKRIARRIWRKLI